ncbi:MAG TPA: hypothetical protein VFN84_09450 [Pseudolabrys sp.]|nr:hypothetical protein [Pseudolabrys sp.]
MFPRFVSAGVVLALAIYGAHADENQHSPGAVEQQGGAVSQHVKLPALHLTNAQREQVRKAVLSKHSDVEFRLKSTKSAKDFEPKVGATLPQGLVPDGFPDSVIGQLPQLRNYAYLKLKDQVLIVDATSRKIVDMFSETQPLT